jgi:hypothetical protein
MRTSDWTSPEIAAIGRKWLADLDLASELLDYGADAYQLTLPYSERDTDRPRTIELPTMMVDVFQAIMIASQVSESRPEESAEAFLDRILGCPSKP